MSNYTTLLMAVDLSDESDRVAERALALAEAHGATLHVIHVIEPLSFAYGGDVPMDFSAIQEEIHEQASQRLKRFAADCNIPQERQHLVLGRPEVSIDATAEEIGADLIVVGNHGRYGLALLMGSTANGILQDASCDVLAVRVGNPGD